MADYTVTCIDEGGGINAAYMVYLLCALALFLVWSLGVPVRHRDPPFTKTV